MANRPRRSEFSSRVTLYEPAAPAALTFPLTPAKRSRSSAPASTSKATIKAELASSPALPRTRSRQSSAITPADEDDKPKPSPKAPKPRKPTPFKVALDKAHPSPKHWEEVYGIIEKQRATIVAPVDNMGCEQGGRDRDEAPPSDKDHRLSILVSLMLSSQTKDPVTHQATMNLRRNLPGGLTVDSLLASSPEEINACIAKVGFHNIKTANLARLAVRLRDEHEGAVPEDLESLLKINGVGPKMAILFLQAIGQNVGIGVDVHVHRITNRLGWHKPATTTPEQTRLNLESWLPKDLHPKINLMLVGFGQSICKPVSPRCDLCDVSARSLCPSARIVSPKKERTTPSKKRRLSSPEEEDAEKVGGRPKVEVEIDDAVIGVKEEGDAEIKEELKEQDGEQEAVKEEDVLPSKLLW